MKYLLLISGTYSDQIRSTMHINRLLIDNELTADVGYYNNLDKQVFETRYDLIVCSRPNNPEILQYFKMRKMPILVDIDDDFWAIPKSHPGYMGIGPGNKLAIDGMEKCLELADAITTSTEILKNKFIDRYGNKVFLVENGWDNSNENWTKSLFIKNPENVYIGWGGTITHRNDFNLVLNALHLITKKFSNTKIVIYGDPEIYLMINKIPENQKVFVPPTEYYLYPGVIGSFDILLAPLLENVFNDAKSDIKLVDAGARKIPWVASRSKAYLKWYEGGCFASTTNEWEEHLSEFIISHYKRKRYGEAGYQKALKRESRVIVKDWIIAAEAAKYNCFNKK